MPSQTYELIAHAMSTRQQVLCVYLGHARALCPTILGHTDGEECTLAYQFAGDSSGGLLSGGEWIDVNPASPYKPKRSLNAIDKR